MASGTGDVTLQAFTADAQGYFAPERSGTGDVSLGAMTVDAVGHIDLNSTGTGDATMAGFEVISRGYFADAQVSAHIVWVREGTVDVTNGSNVVTGNGTTWVSDSIALRAGDIFTIDGTKLYEIEIVLNNNTLLLKDNYAEATQSAINYAAIRMAHVHSKLVADQITIVTRAITREQELKDWETLPYNAGTPTTVDITHYDGTVSTIKSLPQVLGEIQAAIDAGQTGPAGPAGPAGADGTGLVWKGPWVITTNYVTNDSVERGGSTYVCIVDHTSTGDDEPGVGVNEATYWQLSASKGDTGPVGPAGGVTSVFGRSGIVSAQSGDYNATQVINSSGVSGFSVKDALDWLNSNKAAAGHVHGLANLTDVSLGSPQLGHGLIHDGSNFVNRALVQSDIQNLVSDLASINETIAENAARKLQDLADVFYEDPEGWFFAGVLKDVTLSNGDQTVTRGGAPTGDSWATTFWQKKAGKHYFDVTADTLGTPASIRIGIRPVETQASDEIGTKMVSFSGEKWDEGVSVGTITGGTFAATDVMNVAIDLDAGKMWVGKNGTWLDGGDPVAETGENFSWVATQEDYHLAVWFINDASAVQLTLNDPSVASAPGAFIDIPSAAVVEIKDALMFDTATNRFVARQLVIDDVTGLQAALNNVTATIADATDTNFSALSDKQLIRYDAASSKWVNFSRDYYTQAEANSNFAAVGHTHPSSDITFTTIKLDNGSQSAPALSFNSDPDTGIYKGNIWGAEIMFSINNTAVGGFSDFFGLSAMVNNQFVANGGLTLQNWENDPRWRFGMDTSNNLIFSYGEGTHPAVGFTDKLKLTYGPGFTDLNLYSSNFSVGGNINVYADSALSMAHTEFSMTTGYLQVKPFDTDGVTELGIRNYCSHFQVNLNGGEFLIDEWDPGSTFKVRNVETLFEETRLNLLEAKTFSWITMSSSSRELHNTYSGDVFRFYQEQEHSLVIGHAREQVIKSFEHDIRVRAAIKARIRVSIVSGAVTGVTLRDSGFGYDANLTGQTFLLTSTAGGGDGLAEITYDTDASGQMTNLSVSAPGSGYSNGNNVDVEFSDVPGVTNFSFPVEFLHGVLIDSIDEYTSNAGVTIDGVLVKDGLVEGRDVAADGTKLDGIESGATADQSDSEIETAYNNQVAVVSQGDAEAGISTNVYRWTPQRVAQAIAALSDTVPVLEKLNAASALSLTTSYQTLATYSIPANTLGNEDGLMLDLFGKLVQNSGAGRTWTVRISYGGTVIIEDTLFPFSSANANEYAWRMSVLIACDNDASNKYMTAEFHESKSAGGTAATGLAAFTGSRHGPVGVSASFAKANSSAQTLLVEIKSSAATITQQITRQGGFIRHLEH